MSRQNEIDSLNNTFVRAVKNFKPPERLTVSQWLRKTAAYLLKAQQRQAREE